MSHRVRPYIESDAERIVEIINKINPMPSTLEHFRLQEQRRDKNEPFVRMVVEDADGQIVGYGLAHMPKSSPKGWWQVRAVVDPAHRGKGAGRALYNAVTRIALDAGAQRLEGNVRDNDPYTLEWVERRGYIREHHMFESTLDVTTFDLSRWTAEAELPRQHGIELVRFGKNRTDDEVQKLYDLCMRLWHDMPGTENRQVPPMREWRDWVLNSPDSDPEGTFIAVDGDKWVGVSGCTFRQGSDAYTWFTGTLPEYRGKGIALALKLLCIEYVRQKGWKRMRTNNHSKNPAMLRVNEKLGYKPEPGMYWIYKLV